jgi:hypothetical protein
LCCHSVRLLHLINRHPLYAGWLPGEMPPPHDTGCLGTTFRRQCARMVEASFFGSLIAV